MQKDEGFESKSISKCGLLFFVVLIGIISFAASWQIMTKVSGWLNIAKMLTALFCLNGAACVDYREHRIPNIFPLILALGGIIFLVVGYLMGQEGAIAYVVSSAFGAAGCTLALTIAAFLTKNGIGAGDIKLLGALALMGGVYTISGTLFFSVLLCTFVSVMLLVARKKDFHGSVPFGPFVLAGYILTLFIIKF